jgi:hypothetical protein
MSFVKGESLRIVREVAGALARIIHHDIESAQDIARSHAIARICRNR